MSHEGLEKWEAGQTEQKLWSYGMKFPCFTMRYFFNHRKVFEIALFWNQNGYEARRWWQLKRFTYEWISFTEEEHLIVIRIIDINLGKPSQTMLSSMKKTLWGPRFDCKTRSRTTSILKVFLKRLIFYPFLSILKWFHCVLKVVGLVCKRLLVVDGECYSHKKIVLETGPMNTCCRLSLICLCTIGKCL